MIKQWFVQLTFRERLMVVMGMLILTGILGYVMVWEPVIDSYIQLEKKVSSQQVTLNWMESAAQEIRQLRRSSTQSSPPPSQSSLLVLIDESLRYESLQKTTVEPQGEADISVSFEDVNFTEMMQWLEKLYNQHQIKVTSITLERQPEPDRVVAKMTLGKI